MCGAHQELIAQEAEAERLILGFLLFMSIHENKINQVKNQVPSLDCSVEQVNRTPIPASANNQNLDVRKAARLSVKRQTKAQLSQKLRQADLPDVADKLDRCCSQFVVRTCGAHRTKVIPNFRCWQRFCPDCADVLARRSERRYLPILRRVLKDNPAFAPCELTLTVRSGFDPAECFDRLMKVFHKLIRRKLWKRHVKGAIYRVEWTFNRYSGFHFHLHLLAIRGAFLNQKTLSDEWKKITKTSFVVWIARVNETEKSLRQFVKYIFKPMKSDDLTPEQLRSVLSAINGRRMSGLIGAFHGADVVDSDINVSDEFEQLSDFKAGDSCPFCERTLFDVSMSRRQYEQFEFELAGKSLRTIQDSC